ncbi:MAG: MBOAT family protein, partial [Eubacteriales bacterium]|nr:MBOAT family protein [Eubacteriales bacterium]
MLFNSFSFMLFFPIVVLLHFALPHKVRYLWLLVASYYFYMCWNPKYALLIAISTLITYTSGLLIGKESPKWLKKLWVFLSMSSNLAILFFFKYFDFFIENVNRILSYVGMELITPTFDVILPVGISFYTFQALSYTMDVYRGEIYTEKNLFKYALFVSFFPQLVAGPIERSKNLLVQISQRHYFDYERVKSGLLIMLWGFFMKLVIADRVAILVNTVYNDYTNYMGIPLILATIFFGIQIYCDFASYSAIAIGSAQVLGFRLMDNFKQPYFSRSITEFWRRWHISLSTWFRDYLYIPLGGNRKGTVRKYLHIMIVFLVSGLWHGANWTFVIWGFLHGAFQVIGQITYPLKIKITDKLGINREASSYKLGQMLITFMLVNFAWIFFRAPSYTAAKGIIHNMTAQWNPWVFTDGSLYLLGLSQKSFCVAIGAVVILLCVSIAQYK